MTTRSFKGGMKRIKTEQWLVPLIGTGFVFGLCAAVWGKEFIAWISKMLWG